MVDLTKAPLRATAVNATAKQPRHEIRVSTWLGEEDTHQYTAAPKMTALSNRHV